MSSLTTIERLVKNEEMRYGLFAISAGTMNRFRSALYKTPTGIQLPVVSISTRDRGLIPVAFSEGYVPAISEYILDQIVLAGENDVGLSVIHDGRHDAVVQCCHSSPDDHLRRLGNVRRKIKVDPRVSFKNYPSYADLLTDVDSDSLFDLFFETIIGWIKKEVEVPLVDPRVVVSSHYAELKRMWDDLHCFHLSPEAALLEIDSMFSSLITPEKKNRAAGMPKFELLWSAAFDPDGKPYAVSMFVLTKWPSVFMELYWVNTWLDRRRNTELLALNIGTRAIAEGLKLAYEHGCNYNLGFDWFPYKFDVWHAERMPKRGLSYQA